MYKSNRQVLIQAHSLCNSRLWLVDVKDVCIFRCCTSSYNNELFADASFYFIHKLTVHFSHSAFQFCGKS
jgi:hypothetical protein